MSDRPSLAAFAKLACADYEHWAREIPRLKVAIGDCRCPHEVRWRGEEEPPLEEVPSCFSRASEEDIAILYNPYEKPQPFRRRSLDEIAAKVADCPGCAELVRLIRARQHARQRYGVAKREIRRIGKLFMASPEWAAVGSVAAARERAKRMTPARPALTPDPSTRPGRDGSAADLPASAATHREVAEIDRDDLHPAVRAELARLERLAGRK